ncbi:MAG: outer membrane protein assembly factor BamB, partial [Planctomycetota bacterium]
EAPLWHVDIGRGYSSPVVANGKLYIAGYFEDDATPREGVDRVTCIDVKSGEVVWSHSYPSQAFDNEHRGGALSSPAVIGDTVYVPTRAGEVRSYVADSGEVNWVVDLVERHTVEPGRYGFASSPYHLGSMIVLNAGRTVALDRATGETQWITEGAGASYSTVAEIQLGQRACLVSFGGEGLRVIDATDGEQVHNYVFRKAPRNVEGATPLVLGTRVLISSAYEHGIASVDFGGEKPVEQWRSRRMRTKMAGATLWNDHLYGFDESMLSCMDLDGNMIWRERGLGHGALTIAAGRMLVTTSDGELIVAQASPEGFQPLSRQQWIDEGVFWTAPVLSDGRVYMRGSIGDLVCLDHRDVERAASAKMDEVPLGADGLPTPEVLRACYFNQTGYDHSWPAAVRWGGKLFNNSLGLSDVACQWTLGSGGRWVSRVELPFGDNWFIQRVFDGKAAWEVNPYKGNSMIEGAGLDELRSTDGFHFLKTPFELEQAKTVGRERFRGIDCWRIDVTLAPDHVRRVFIDAKTGLLTGRTSDDEHTVLFTEWSEYKNLRFPMHRTEFHPETGEESRWRFEGVREVALDDSTFEMPEELLEPDDEANEDSEEPSDG